MYGIVKRILLFVTGLFIMSVAVALSVKSNLGVSPISCIPYVLSVRFTPTLGQLTIVFNMLLVALQVVILRKRYKLMQLVQLPVVILFGFFIDFSVFLLTGVEISGYISRLLICLLSCAILALGVLIEVKARITYLPGEGVALAIADSTPLEFGRAKMIVDCTMVLSGAALSLVFFHGLNGVREGTVVAAVLVGFLVRSYSDILDSLVNQRKPVKNLAEETAVQQSEV